MSIVVKVFVDMEMFNPLDTIILHHQEMQIPSGQLSFNLILEFFVFQKFICIHKIWY
jgi:hypothetical protein